MVEHKQEHYLGDKTMSRSKEHIYLTGFGASQASWRKNEKANKRLNKVENKTQLVVKKNLIAG
jgi:hypothetical protein